MTIGLLAGDSAPAAVIATASSTCPESAKPTWIELSVAVLRAAGRPLRARDIYTLLAAAGTCPPSAGHTPWQSINRALHGAIRNGDPRLEYGEGPGLFQFASDAPAMPRTTPVRRTAQAAAGRQSAPVERIPSEPLESLVARRGGLHDCGLKFDASASAAERRRVYRLQRAYHRGRSRGWFTIYDADELSIELFGVHPSMVWDEGWWEAIDAPEVSVEPGQILAAAG